MVHQILEHGTKSVPHALTTHLYAVIPLPRKKGEPKPAGESKKDKEKAIVPPDAREIATMHVTEGTALDFAKLTGDFNPIHWVPPYAKASGFPNTILHGYCTMARSFERIRRHVLAEGEKFTVFDVKFTKPLVLPRDVAVFVDDERNLYVGEAKGSDAFMTGSYETDAPAKKKPAKKSAPKKKTNGHA